MKKCPWCGHESGDGAAHCPRCGTALPEPAPPPSPPPSTAEQNRNALEAPSLAGTPSGNLTGAAPEQLSPAKTKKKCPWCGHESGGDAVQCPRCGTALPEPAPPPPPPSTAKQNPNTLEAPGQASAPPGSLTGAAPERLSPAALGRWNPKSAWQLCLLLLFVTIPGGIISVRAAIIFTRWTGQRPLGTEGFTVAAVAVECILYPLVTLLFLRCRTLAEFVRCLGFHGRVPEYAVILLPLGFLLRAAARYFASPAGDVTWFTGFTPAGLALGLSGAFVEEPLMRGYLYPAFRTRYPVWKAVAAILVIAAVSHYPVPVRAPISGLFIALMQVMCCLLRERSTNLYPCVLFHLGYNLGP
jgi:membrane protease YdiL (CAAX protease family)